MGLETGTGQVGQIVPFCGIVSTWDNILCIQFLKTLLPGTLANILLMPLHYLTYKKLSCLLLPTFTSLFLQNYWFMSLCLNLLTVIPLSTPYISVTYSFLPSIFSYVCSALCWRYCALPFCILHLSTHYLCSIHLPIAALP